MGDWTAMHAGGFLAKSHEKAPTHRQAAPRQSDSSVLPVRETEISRRLLRRAQTQRAEDELSRRSGERLRTPQGSPGRCVFLLMLLVSCIIDSGHGGPHSSKDCEGRLMICSFVASNVS